MPYFQVLTQCNSTVQKFEQYKSSEIASNVDSSVAAGRMTLSMMCITPFLAMTSALSMVIPFPLYQILTLPQSLINRMSSPPKVFSFTGPEATSAVGAVNRVQINVTFFVSLDIICTSNFKVSFLKFVKQISPT